jgi:hypothetical protein
MKTPITCDCPSHEGSEIYCNCCARKGETRPIDAVRATVTAPAAAGDSAAETERFEKAYAAAFGVRLPEMATLFDRLADGSYGYVLVRAALRVWQAARSQSAPAAQGGARPLCYARESQILRVAKENGTTLSVTDEPCGYCVVPFYTTPQPSAPGVVTDAMVEAACHFYHGPNNWLCLPEPTRANYRDMMRGALDLAISADPGAQPSADDAPHADDVAVDRFAARMKAKMSEARAKGRSGWDDPAECDAVDLAEMLIRHLVKGNSGTFEDVANFCMMLSLRGESPAILKRQVDADGWWNSYECLNCALVFDVRSFDEGRRYARCPHCSRDCEFRARWPANKSGHGSRGDQDAPPADARDGEDATVDWFRANGWAVAVHNDYRLNGEPHTFWLFTRGDRFVKGEGRSDAEALARAFVQADRAMGGE